VSLTRRERRALRTIEAALAEEDPRLGALLSASPPVEVVITGIAWRVLAASTLLLVFGAVLGSASVATTGLFLLEVSLAALLIMAAGRRVAAKPSDRRADDEGEGRM
jgi:hypothetical protein